MKRNLLVGLFLVGMVAAHVNPANATLITIGTATYGASTYGLIYDVEDQITWLDYSNSGATYPESLAWAASLNDPGELTINLDAGYTASWTTPWRLPEANGWWTNASWNGVTDSELESLYYDELGNELDDASISTGPFENIVYGIQNASFYYMEPTFPISISYAPEFNFYDGSQGFVTSSVNGGIYAMAVRSGAVSMIPEPSTALLLAAGLVGLAAAGRRRSHH
jgi:hypothetical protein